MAYSEAAAQRVRKALGRRPKVSERKMFGGLAFLLRDHMCCGILGDELMVRVGPDACAAALSRPHARKMDFTGKPLKGFVYVAPPGFASDVDLKAWIARAVAFSLSLPAKAAAVRTRDKSS